MITRTLQKHLGLGHSLLRYHFSKLQSFTDLQQFNSYLLAHKPTFHIVYFAANWNPQCKEADEHAQWVNDHSMEVFRICTDKAPKIARHYDIKAEPEFVLCMYGDEIVRHIGLNLEGLKNKIKQIENLANSTNPRQYNQTWVPYGTGFRAQFDENLRYRRDWCK